MDKDVFTELSAVDVSKFIEKKKSNNKELSYLSWTHAWAAVRARFPEATYEIKFFNGFPWVYDEKTGYMVFTTVTIGNETHEMWLSVMDFHNAAMKDTAYTVKTKYAEYTVLAADMNDINKTIMRCLTKNLAMFGLGLNIYAGEDLPIDWKTGTTEDEKGEAEMQKDIQRKLTPVEVATLKTLCVKKGYDPAKVFPSGVENLTSEQYVEAVKKLS